MLIQGIECGYFHDLVVIIRFMAVFMLIYLGFQIARKIREANILSATTGFSLFLFSFGISHFFFSLMLLYPEFDNLTILNFILNLAMVMGMVFTIILAEIDSALHDPNTFKTSFKYRYSLFALIGVTAFIISYFLAPVYAIMLMLIVIIPFAMAVNDFMKKFETLEIVRQTNPLPTFFIGLSLVGFSNFINAFATQNTLVYFVIINTLCIIIGALLMARVWHRLPSLSEFDWMRKMERLIVMHTISSLQMYKYDFQVAKKDAVDSDLAGSAIGGVDMLLKEILASEGESHTKEIVHGDKTITFSYGIATSCILISNGTSDEFRYRLNLFHLAFEKQYGEENLEQWQGDVSLFYKTDDLLRKHFLQ